MHTYDFERMMRADNVNEAWRLTTAEILYHLPDHPLLLQSYTWQEVDLVPDFPQLKKFLNFWERELEGRLHSVQVAFCENLRAAEWVHGRGEFTVH